MELKAKFLDSLASVAVEEVAFSVEVAAEVEVPPSRGSVVPNKR